MEASRRVVGEVATDGTRECNHCRNWDKGEWNQSLWSSVYLVVKLLKARPALSFWTLNQRGNRARPPRP